MRVKFCLFVLKLSSAEILMSEHRDYWRYAQMWDIKFEFWQNFFVLVCVLYTCLNDCVTKSGHHDKKNVSKQCYAAIDLGRLAGLY